MARNRFPFNYAYFVLCFFVRNGPADAELPRFSNEILLDNHECMNECNTPKPTRLLRERRIYQEEGGRKRSDIHHLHGRPIQPESVLTSPASRNPARSLIIFIAISARTHEKESEHTKEFHLKILGTTKTYDVDLVRNLKSDIAVLCMDIPCLLAKRT